MHKLATKIGVGVIGGAMATLLTIGPAFAAPRLRCVIKNNGRDSRNTCELKVEKKKEVEVKNEADFSNRLTLTFWTGDNKAKDNDDKVDIKTGKIDVTITITNRANAEPPSL